MDFSVHMPDQPEWTLHGNSTYEIGLNNAVLTVRDEDGNQTIYSPSAWLRIAERPRDYDQAESVR